MAKAVTAEAAAAATPRTVVYLGNRKATQTVDGTREPLAGKRCTTVVFPADISLMEALQAITSPQGVWAAHSDAAAPAWVAGSGPLAEPIIQLLSAQYPGVEIREPEPAQEG
jgi:hypothetical protein